ncbi:MAG: DEAD/DEAH box helicase, partial [Gemmatimonadota bacterium]
MNAQGVLDRFHPAVRRWFEERFEAPTAPQRAGWGPIGAGRHTLISAPTGSGKTLAAFLSALDELLREGVEGDGLPDETRVVYVSPLKALSADIHRNLQEPRRGIREVAEEMGLPPVRITAGVRTGDTPRSERRRMVETPPHVLVTTPESLYLYLTAERSRETLR